MKRTFLIVSAVLGWAVTAHAATGTCLNIGTPVGGTTCTSPAHLYQQIFEVMVSTDPHCTGLIPLFQTASPTTWDFTQSPTVGAGVIPNGTYNCIAAHTNEIQTFVPQDATADCVPGTTYYWDTFTSGTSTAPDGHSITARGGPGNPIEDDPWSYNSTIGSLSYTGRSPDNAMPLAAPWVVNGDQTKTWVVDFDYTIGDNVSGCIPIYPGQIYFR